MAAFVKENRYKNNPYPDQSTDKALTIQKADQCCKQPKSRVDRHRDTTAKMHSHFLFLCIASSITSPICAGDFATETPAMRKASILLCASPFPPEMIAPAWPIRRPGGAVKPAI